MKNIQTEPGAMIPALIFLALFLSGCIPAQSFSFPEREKVIELRDPTESQMFNAPVSRVRVAVKQSLLNNGMSIDTEEDGFIAATEPVWSRMWSWNYTIGTYLFDEGTATRVTMVVNGAPDILLPFSLGLAIAAQNAEARQIRIQLFNSIRGLLYEARASGD